MLDRRTVLDVNRHTVLDVSRHLVLDVFVEFRVSSWLVLIFGGVS